MKNNTEILIDKIFSDPKLIDLQKEQTNLRLLVFYKSNELDVADFCMWCQQNEISFNKLLP